MNAALPVVRRELTVLEQLIGEEAALKLRSDFGGRRLYVPAAPGEHHPITVSIGPQAAAVLAEAFAGTSGMDVPMLGAKKARIVALDAAGWTRRRIAREMIVTERRVYQVLQEVRDAADGAPPRQGSLF